MTIGMILLIAVGLLILLGVGQRVLDRMRLNDKSALLFIALMLGLGFIPDIYFSEKFALNLGGGLVPLALCAYLFIKAGSAKERIRSAVAALLTGAIVFAIGRFSPDEPETMLLDPILLYGLAAGLIAYIFGRSRRCAFIAGVLGTTLSGLATALWVWSKGIDQSYVLGGAGVFDAIVISGLTAVLLAEILGEVFERLSRGSKRPSREYRNGEFVREERPR